MPIKLAKETTRYSIQDKHGESRTYVYYDNLAKRHETQVSSSEAKSGIIPSNLDQMANDLIVAVLEMKDENSVTELLNRKHIIRVGDRSTFSSGNQGYGEWMDGEEQTYHYRPFIEALFFENHIKFKMLVDATLKAIDEIPRNETYELTLQKYKTFCANFLMSLHNTDLHNPSLLVWDRTVQQKMLQEIEKLNSYALLLKQNEDPKAHHKGELAEQLANTLKDKITHKKMDESSPLHAMEILQFKLEILKDLHQHDKIFAEHTDWKRFVANTLSILLTAGIANLFNYLMTGHGLFYAKTETQNKVLNAQKSLGFDTEKDIQGIEMKI